MAVLQPLCSLGVQLQVLQVEANIPLRPIISDMIISKPFTSVVRSSPAPARRKRELPKFQSSADSLVTAKVPWWNFGLMARKPCHEDMACTSIVLDACFDRERTFDFERWRPVILNVRPSSQVARSSMWRSKFSTLALPCYATRH